MPSELRAWVGRCRPAPATAVPVVLVFVNALAFWLVRPDVPDLWAARARASAVRHGVGLTYWFSWFGGVTPGSYSVLTPYLCAKLGTEFVESVAAIVVMVPVTGLVRNTPRPLLAGSAAAFAVVVNLWCGRVPFLLGGALAAGALLCVQRRVRTGAAVLSVAAVLASPVAGAFLCLGLPGVLLVRGMRAYRAAALVAVAGAGAALIAVAAVFGAPGAEPFPAYLLGEIALALAVLLIAAPSGQLRATLLTSGAVALVLYFVPTGLGANLVRLALFCLPPAALALSRRPAGALAVLMTPIAVLSLLSSVSTIRSAASPKSAASYYAPLADEMDRLSAPGYRLELVGASHAAYAALLDHATLAQGWETQENEAVGARLDSPSLDAHSYRAWLDDYAVGFVAVNLPVGTTPEARVVADHDTRYLRPIWRSTDWQLFAVSRPTPIVGHPATLTASTQATVTVRVPCACSALVRVRWSRFLSATARGPSVVGDYRPELARAAGGWTTLTTNRAGTYVLTGSL